MHALVLLAVLAPAVWSLRTLGLLSLISVHFPLLAIACVPAPLLYRALVACYLDSLTSLLVCLAAHMRVCMFHCPLCSAVFADVAYFTALHALQVIEDYPNNH